MPFDFKLPPISSEECTPLVDALLHIISLQAAQITKQVEQIQLGKEQIQVLRDEIAVLKGQKPRPKIPKSNFENPDQNRNEKRNKNDKRAGSAKRSKTSELEIHETINLDPIGYQR